MTEEIEYYAEIPIPDDDNHPEWDYKERRAYLYREATQHGGTRSLPKTMEEYANQFDTSPSNIFNDLEKVRESILTHDLKTDKVRETVAKTLEWAAEQAKQENDINAAVRAAKEYKEWAQDVGKEDRKAEKLEVEHTDGADKLREIYQSENSSGGDEDSR